MDQDRLAAANRIFDAALNLPPEQRDAEIEARCGSDIELRDLVRRLLAHGLGPDAALDPGPARNATWREALFALAADQGFVGEPQTRIGNHRLLRRLGQGGSADVYLAERQQGGVVQEVAIKLLRADAADAVSLARFRQEQQILARLSHANIGRIFDVGLSEGGRAYFVMEYVDGLPIDQYCDRHRLDLRARLRLFLRVADAVSHAHAELIVHRDIKPSNVLVDAHGQARLVDFGIAKILDEASIDPELTLPGSAPATPGFASPEQLAGRSVGTASDIYQLGLLLHLLVCGLRPFATRGLSASAVALLAREAPRIAPSRRLRSLLQQGERERVELLAAARGTRPEGLIRALVGDPDTVVLKAIAADPAERYGSVAQFADDVRNLLDRRPVSAHPPSAWYLLRRTMRRHRLVSALLVVLLLGLIGFSIVVGSLAWRLDQARIRAERQSLLAEQVTEFFVESFRAAEPQHGGAEGSLVKAALDRASAAPAERLGSDPGFEARLRLVLGRAYESLHEFGLAEREYRRTLEAAANLPSAERSVPLYQAYNGLGRTAMRSARSDEARRYLERVVELTEGDRGALELHAAALANLANVHDQLYGAAAREVALDYNARAMRGFDALYGPDALRWFAIRLQRAQLLSGDERYAPTDDLRAALRITSELLPRLEPALGRDDVTALRTRLLHHRLQAWLGQHDAAVAGLRALQPQAERLLGVNDLFVLNSRRVLGYSLAQRGQIDAGLAEIDAAIAGFLQRYGDRHPNLGSSRFDRAVVLLQAGRREEARAAMEQAEREYLAHEPELQALLAP